MSYRKKIVERITRMGRPPHFATPADLWAEFERYVEAVEKDPVELPQTFVKGQLQNKLSAGKVARPLTLQGFMAFCGLGCSWSSYKHQRKEQPDFQAVIKNIEAVVNADQIEGGLAGVYNSNLTARLTGLSDHQQLTGFNGKPLDLKFEIIDPKPRGKRQ